MRTSTLIVRLPPTRSNSVSWSDAQDLRLRLERMSPISSRKSVPPSADLELALARARSRR
jgi:hypothetical protein